MIAAGEKYKAQWVCAGPISKRGHPHHPLYLKKEEPLRPFDMNEYINNPSFRWEGGIFHNKQWQEKENMIILLFREIVYTNIGINK